MAGLLPVVAEDVDAGELLDRDLGLARAVGAHQARVLPRPKGSLVEHDLAARRHGHDDVRGERVLPARRHRPSDLLRDLPGAVGVQVPNDDVATARAEGPSDRAPVHARADHRSRPAVRAAERLGGEHGRCAGPSRRDRARVEHGDERPVRGVRQEHETRHRRQPARRIPGERRDPFQERVPAAERRHGAEVARRVGRHVDLGRHRPFAACIGDEGVTHSSERAFR